MIVRLGMAPRNDGMGFEDFQEHWRTSHADVVSTLPGLRRYVQLHAVLENGAPVLPYPGFDACSALSFDDVDAMDAAFGSEAFRDDVVRDEQEFVDKTRFTGAIAEWRSGAATIDALGPVVTATLWRCGSGQTVDDLVAALSTNGLRADQGLLVVDQAAHEGRFPAAADVIELVGHPSVGEAVTAARASGQDDGAVRVAAHLARPVVVVGAPADTTDPEQGRTS